MSENQLLAFACRNPSPAELQEFILQHPELSKADADALRTALRAAEIASADGDDAPRALNQKTMLFRAVNAPSHSELFRAVNAPSR